MFAEEVLIPILAIISFHAAVIVFIYMFFTSRNRIRMALIEQGKDAGIFRKDFRTITALRNGMVGLMGGVGLLLGYFLERTGVPGFVAYSSMVLIFGGLGLIGFYWYVKSRGIAEELV